MARMLNDESASFARNMGNWTHSATFTANRGPDGDSIPSKNGLVSSVKLLLHLINRRIFNHGADRKGFTIASFATYETGAYALSPHIHMALACPNTISSDDFSRLIRDVAVTVSGIGREMKIKSGVDDGWITYITKEGSEAIVLELCRAAKP